MCLGEFVYLNSSALNRAHQLTAISTEMEISGWFSKDQTSCFKMISPIKKTVKGFTEQKKGSKVSDGKVLKIDARFAGDGSQV